MKMRNFPEFLGNYLTLMVVISLKRQVLPSLLQYGEDISPALGQYLLLQPWAWRPSGAVSLLYPS